MKKSVPIKPFWYSDKIVWPKTVTIITTLNKEGVPNAAPVSGIIHYDNMDAQPRVRNSIVKPMNALGVEELDEGSPANEHLGA